MTIRPRDPLLLAARIATVFGMGLAALVAVATTIAAPAVLVFRAEIAGDMTSIHGGPVGANVAVALALVLLLVAAMGACAFLFQRHLLRIIDSVGLRDPFVPQNARRLAAMGWLTLGIEALSLPIGGIGQWLSTEVRDATLDFGVDMGGLLLALVLFVLARVFREGARMREDLEGTV